MRNIFNIEQKSANDVNQRTVTFNKSESIIVSSDFVRQENNASPNNQIQNQRKSFESIAIDEQDIIYQEYLYDKFLLSPIEKYQKYGKWPIKLIVHVMLVLLTTSQILYSSNTLSTNSTEQYEQWRQLFFQEPSNKNVKNEEFENKMIYYTTVQKFQNQTLLMFDEMNENNTNRIQDVYFNYSDISLKVYYNYPMDPHLSDYINKIEEDDGEDDDKDDDNNDDKNQQEENEFDQDLEQDKTDLKPDQNNQKKTPKMLNQRNFYEELNLNMKQDIQRNLLNRSNQFTQQRFKQQKYNQVQLVYPVNRAVGIQQPFDINNITQIKQIFQFTNHMELVINNVILIKSNLISCWEFNIIYNLYGHATIQALLLADGGICTEDLFQKGILLHQQEYFNSYAKPSRNMKQNSQGTTKLQDNLNQQDEELAKKREQMKVRGTRYNTFPSPSSSKKQQKKTEKFGENRKKAEQPKGQKFNKQLLIGGNLKPPDYERNGNLYKSGNLLFIGFNTFIDVMTFGCSAISLILSLKYLVQIIDVYIQTFEKSTKAYISKDLKKKQKLQKKKGKYLTLQRILAEQRGWNELSLWEKISYFDLWFFVILIGNFFQMVGSIYLIFLDSQSELDQKTIIVNWTIGVGCFCAWCSLMKYFEHSKSMAIILDVLKFALPQLFKVLIEFSILYISFIIIGMTSFWQSERFSDISSTAVTLFGVVLSDSIFYVAQDCEQNGVLPRFMADLYVIIFTLLFIICVTNIMIGILEDGYSRNKMEQKFKKTIENVDNEKDRAVISKMVQKKELDRGNMISRRLGSFDSDDGINYGKNNTANLLSPFSGAHQQSPSFKTFTPSQKSLQTSPLNFPKSPKTSDKSKSSPLVQMKMVQNAGIAIQKAKRFVQIKRKEKQEQEKPQSAIAFPIIDQSEEKDISMFDDQNQLFFQIDQKEQINQEQVQQAPPQVTQLKKEQKSVEFFDQDQEQQEEIKDETLEQELERQRQLSQRRKLKSKTLHHLMYQTIDEQDSNDSEKDEKQSSLQKITSFQNIEEIPQQNLQKANSLQEEDNNLSFSRPLTFGSQTNQFFQELKTQRQLSASQVFKRELETLKQKEIFVEKTNQIFNGGYKKIKFYLEESQKLVINTKFLQVTRQQKRYLFQKYSSYLQYFQQRIAANLLELEYFKLD